MKNLISCSVATLALVFAAATALADGRAPRSLGRGPAYRPVPVRPVPSAPAGYRPAPTYQRMTGEVIQIPAKRVVKFR